MNPVGNFWRRSFTCVPLGRYMLNTLPLAVVKSRGATVFGAAGGSYAFARLVFPVVELINVIATMMVR